MLTEFIHGIAAHTDAQDRDLAFAIRQRVARHDVTREYVPTLQQLWMLSDSGDDVWGWGGCHGGLLLGGGLSARVGGGPPRF